MTQVCCTSSSACPGFISPAVFISTSWTRKLKCWWIQAKSSSDSQQNLLPILISMKKGLHKQDILSKQVKTNPLPQSCLTLKKNEWKVTKVQDFREWVSIYANLYTLMSIFLPTESRINFMLYLNRKMCNILGAAATRTLYLSGGAPAVHTDLMIQ